MNRGAVLYIGVVKLIGHRGLGGCRGLLFYSRGFRINCDE